MISKLKQRPIAQHTLNLEVKLLQGAYDRHHEIPHELACNQNIVQGKEVILLLNRNSKQ